MDNRMHQEHVVLPSAHIKLFSKMKQLEISNVECMINKWIQLSIFSNHITNKLAKAKTKWLL
jgi:hypothetical protein